MQVATRGSTLLWALLTLSLQVAYAWWAYGPCTTLFFHFDDFWAIGGASMIDIRSPLDVWQFFKPTHGFLLYRPISMVAYFWALRELFGFDPRYYHLAQIGLVVLNSMLVFGIVQRLTRRPALAAACALTYGLAPGHAIAACWNALATAVLTATFYFAAVYRWLGPPRRRRLTTFLWFGLALCSSEHGVTLPVALLLISFTVLDRRRRSDDLRTLAPALVISALYVGAKLIYLRFFLAYDFPDLATQMFIGSAYATSLSPALILTNLGYYVSFMFAPLYQELPNDVVALALGALLLVGAAGSVVVVAWRPSAPAGLALVALGLGLFVVAVAPVLPLLAHRNTYYISIPGLGAAIALAACGRRFATNFIVAAAVAGLCAGVQLRGGMERVRSAEEFKFLHSFTSSALLWVHMAYSRTLDRPVDTVYVHENSVTDHVFRQGLMHKLILCADYDVQMVPEKQPLPPDSPTSISLPDKVDGIPYERMVDRSWMHLRGCPPS